MPLFRSFTVRRLVVCRSAGYRSAPYPSPVLWALLLPLLDPSVSFGQDLVGCQLVEGTLQCVPGTTAWPPVAWCGS